MCKFRADAQDISQHGFSGPQGLDRVMCVSVGDSSRVLLRQYRIRLKKTGTKVELPASLLHRFVRGVVDAVNVCNPSCSPLQSTRKAIPPAAANTVPATGSLGVCLGDVFW